jgi:trehalose 6-phosphate synthase
MVPIHQKTALLVQIAAIVDRWLLLHPEFDKLWGNEVIEIRPRAARKGNAVAWVKGKLGDQCRLLIVGDDVTDEDMFSASAGTDATVVVGTPSGGRLTAARWQLESAAETLSFYRWIVSVRKESAPPARSRQPSRVETMPDSSTGLYDLLVLSNRLPELRSTEAAADPRKRNVGGLVSALQPALSNRRGIWLGWSGRTRPDATGTTDVGLDVVSGVALAWVDFPEAWHKHYYNGLSNSALWPLFQSFHGRVKFAHEN